MTSTADLQRAMRAAQSPNNQIRMKAAIWLESLADHTVAGELVDLLVAEEDPFVRETLTWVIVGQADSTLPHLIDALEGNDPSRAQVLHALSKIGDASAVEHVLPLLDDQHPEVAAKAWWVLGRVQVPESAPLLVERLGIEADEELRTALTRALQYLGEPAVPGVAEAVRSSNPAVSRHAVEVLVAMGEPAIGALDALAEAAHGDDRDVAVLAMEAMVPLADPSIDELLASFRDGEDRWLASVADWFLSERRDLAARAERIQTRARRS